MYKLEPFFFFAIGTILGVLVGLSIGHLIFPLIVK